MNFIEEILEDPVKLWGSVIVVFGVLFYIFSGNDNVKTSDPFADSSFVSQEQIAEADEEFFDEEEDSFVSEEDMQQDNSEDSFMVEDQFDTQKPLTFKRSVFDKTTGTIVEKEFDIQGHEIKPTKPTTDKDKKIEQLEKRIGRLEQKLDKDPFLN